MFSSKATNPKSSRDLLKKINCLPQEFFIYLISLMLFAQIPISFVAYQLEIPNNNLMLIYRGIILIASLLIITTRRNYSNTLDLWEIIIISFWGIYFIRLGVDLLAFNIQTAVPIWHLLAWGLGSSLFPALAIYSLSLKQKTPFNIFPVIIFGTISLGVSILMFSFNFNLFGSIFLLPSLNPITAGHAGASLFLISLCYIYSDKSIGLSRFKYSISTIGCLIGIAVTLSSATRSAFLSILIGSIVIYLFQNRLNGFRKNLYILLLVIIGASISFYLFGSSDLIYKLKTLGQGESEINRIIFASTGLKYWLQNPIFGIGFKIHNLLDELFIDLNPYYPHNFIIESLVLGGISLCGFLIAFFGLTTWNAIKLINVSASDLWLVCLWIQSFIYVMVSGHLGNVPFFWFSSAAICGRYQALNKLKSN